MFGQEELLPQQVFLVYAQADKRIKKTLRSVLQPHGLTMYEWLLLASVGRGPERGMIASDVATRVGVSRAQTTLLARTLVEKKLINQEAGQRDGRSVKLVIRARGRSLLELIDEELQVAFSDVTAGLGNQPLRGMLESLMYISVPKKHRGTHL